MRLRRRRGVSAYLEVFLLVGVAVGGSAVVLRGSAGRLASVRGSAVTIESVSIRQGAFASVESVLVANTGGTVIPSLTVTTVGVPGPETFCLSVFDQGDRTLLETSCPGMTEYPQSVSVEYPLAPGSGLEVEILMQGAPFAVGSSHLVSVTTSDGSQQSLEAMVVPA